MMQTTESVPRNSFVAGTRASALAIRQTNLVLESLRARWPGIDWNTREYSTHGDGMLDRPLTEIGGRGAFTESIERALSIGEIDFAVHSLKDLPVESAAGLIVAAVVGPRISGEVLVSRHGMRLDHLPRGAVVGTSSLRRRAQLLALRSDLRIRDIRGNVETRIAKVMRGEYDATVLAAAGVERLGRQNDIVEYLSADVLLPAPGQGGIAVQCRADDRRTIERLAALDDEEVRGCTLAERSFLKALGGGCSAPVAALAVRSGEPPRYRLVGRVIALDGSRTVEVEGNGVDPAEVGSRLAESASARGAGAILRVSGVGRAREPFLAGRRVVVTRARAQNADIVKMLEGRGAQVIELPTIRTEAIEETETLTEVLARLDEFDRIVFTSRNAVDYFFAVCRSGDIELGPLAERIAAVGPATAGAVEAHGLVPAFVSRGRTGADLAAEIPEVFGKRVLLPCAERRSEELTEGLLHRGARVEALPVYRTVSIPLDRDSLSELRAGVDWVLFTSGSTVRGLLEGVRMSGDEDLLHSTGERLRFACIGATTAAAAREAGLSPVIVSTEHTASGLVSAILKAETESNK